MEDRQIHETIEKLVAEEQRLWEQQGSDHTDTDEQEVRGADSGSRYVLGPPAPASSAS
jgi:hypothetical protein